MRKKKLIVQTEPSTSPSPPEPQPQPIRSEMASETIEYNKEQIWEAAWYAALQSMPIMLARGILTDVHKQTSLLQEKIEEVLAYAIDERESWHEDTVDIYTVKVSLAQHFGSEITHRNRNVYQLDVDVSVLLNDGNFYFAPQHYPAAKRWGEKLFSIGDVAE